MKKETHSPEIDEAERLIAQAGVHHLARSFIIDAIGWAVALAIVYFVLLIIEATL